MFEIDILMHFCVEIELAESSEVTLNEGRMKLSVKFSQKIRVRPPFEAFKMISGRQLERTFMVMRDRYFNKCGHNAHE